MHQGTFLMVTLLSMTSATLAAAAPDIEGRWVGGYQNGTRVVAMDVTFDGDAEATGTADLPQLDEHGIPLRSVTRKGSSLHFEIPGIDDPLRFDGRIENERRISGRVRQNASATTFELLRTVALSREDLESWWGTYEWAPGKVLLIAQGDGDPVYVDYESNRTGTLVALSDDELIAGPSIGTPFPIARRLRAMRDESGRVVRVTVTDGGRRITAERRQFYTEEPVRFFNGEINIGASLLLPSTPGPHPAIVMVHGSGPVTRHMLRPFADHFARHGVAVLMPDKRGTGSSTGRWGQATFEDLAGDALAGVRFLQRRADIREDGIGLLGTSLGGWVAPLAAAMSGDVAFVVVESAPTVTPREHERMRVESVMRADGESPERIARALAFMDRKFEVARTGQGWDGLVSAIDQATREGWAPYVNPPTSLASLRWNWEHVFSYDPVPVLTRLDVPMLVLYGGLDSVVPAKLHRTRMERFVRDSGKQNVTIMEFARANHGFFEAVTGGRREQPTLVRFVPGYFEARTAWVLARTRSLTLDLPRLRTSFTNSSDESSPRP